MTEMTLQGIPIQHYDELASTNKTAMAMTTWTHLTTIVADSQTAGRGRIGRTFYAYPGGLYMTVLLDPTQITLPLQLLTPAAALSVKCALNRAGVPDLQIKWVNDLLQNGKKVAGILTEAKTVDGRIERIAVGIGINLGPHNNFPQELQDRAASLHCQTDKLTLAAAITNGLSQQLTAAPGDITKAYEASLAFMGETVTATDYANHNAPITGTIQGITPDGFLQIKTPDGILKTLSSGEINT